jgi:hypothetical protein
MEELTAKSINDKCDCSYVMTKITNKMWNAMVGSLRVGAREGLIDYNCLDSVDCRPTHILDVYKNRRGRLKDIRIWTRLNLGTGERKDLFITNAANMAIPIPDDTLFQTHTEMIDNWRDKIEMGESTNDN